MKPDTRAGRKVIEIRSGSELKQRQLDSRMDLLRSEAQPASARDVHVAFDWSGVGFADLATVVWFLVILDQLKSQGYSLTLKLPTPEPEGSSGWRLWSFLHRWRFFDALSCIDHPANLLLDNQLKYLPEEQAYKYSHSYVIDQDGNLQQAFKLSLLEITSFKLKSGGVGQEGEARRALDLYQELWRKKIILQALCNWCGWSEDVAKKFVTRTVVEILDNARGHSGGSWVLSAFSVDRRNLLLSFADNGNGIPSTLRSLLREAGDLKMYLEGKSDAELIKYFADSRMIRDSELIGFSTKGIVGRGLYYCKQKILENDGELRIRSGSGCVVFKPDGSEEPHDGLFKSNGTALRILVPRKD